MSKQLQKGKRKNRTLAEKTLSESCCHCCTAAVEWNTLRTAFVGLSKSRNQLFMRLAALASLSLVDLRRIKRTARENREYAAVFAIFWGASVATILFFRFRHCANNADREKVILFIHRLHRLFIPLIFVAQDFHIRRHARIKIGFYSDSVVVCPPLVQAALFL